MNKRIFSNLLMLAIWLFGFLYAADKAGERIKAEPAPIKRLFAGAGGNAIFFTENATSVDYSANYVLAGFHLSNLHEAHNLWFVADAGMAWLNKLLVNQYEINMDNRSQIFIPLRGAVYLPFGQAFGFGGGMSGVIETEMKYRGESTPGTASFQTFLFGGIYARIFAGDKWEFYINPTLGLNPIPGRTNRTSIAKLIHVQLNFSVGVQYRFSP